LDSLLVLLDEFCWNGNVVDVNVAFLGAIVENVCVYDSFVET
jgi:hypothetical protein